MRSEKALNSFIRYCKNNPQLRFWQALRAWSGYNIYVTKSTLNFTNKENVIEPLIDPFYWEDNHV